MPSLDSEDGKDSDSSSQKLSASELVQKVQGELVVFMNSVL